MMQRNAEAWEGFDFMTIDGGVNPLIASYTGAPFQARGVDPNTTAQASVAFWRGLLPGPDLSDLPTDMGPSTLKKIGFGAVGSLLAIVLIAIGLLIIVKS